MIQQFLKLFQDEQPTEPVKSGECSHQWEFATKTYAPAIRPIANSNIDLKILQKMLFGVTTYMWQCKHCGASRIEEMLGTDENRLDDILDKVDKFGMQYVKERGNVYGIAQWVPETLNLPITENNDTGKSGTK